MTESGYGQNSVDDPWSMSDHPDHLADPGERGHQHEMIHSGLVRYYPTLGPLLVPIDDVQPHPDNYNNGDVEEVMASIETNGMYRPIYVERQTGYALGGNTTWEACKGLDATEIPVIYLDTPDEATSYRIMVGDNELARLAVPDPPLLVNLLDRIKDETGSLLGTGKTERDLESLRALAQIGLDSDDFAQWPTICFKVPPHVRRAFYHVTREADDDRERFEVLLRLAGWDGT